jgi:hypothetical protein
MVAVELMLFTSRFHIITKTIVSWVLCAFAAAAEPSRPALCSFCCLTTCWLVRSSCAARLCSTSHCFVPFCVAMQEEGGSER